MQEDYELYAGKELCIGLPLRKKIMILPQEFYNGNRNDLVTTFPVFGRSILGYNLFNRAMRDEKALIEEYNAGSRSAESAKYHSLV
jgi:hypothetical protein